MLHAIAAIVAGAGLVIALSQSDPVLDRKVNPTVVTSLVLAIPWAGLGAMICFGAAEAIELLFELRRRIEGMEVKD